MRFDKVRVTATALLLSMAAAGCQIGGASGEDRPDALSGGAEITVGVKSGRPGAERHTPADTFAGSGAEASARHRA
ncbi:hypothetical protein [Streptomyces sp. AK02-01A]|uniref:hypothetical protein n=1 Tax=Streptomyces sp. AK02-01A TaxID=3028648 RepID=UPI0029A1A77C|nr:hypothetical protein [Streptomyces sp. AK02-01A]MDX3849262.1 hypothetical protein [Streptomyces sp. AK02-01A]